MTSYPSRSSSRKRGSMPIAIFDIDGTIFRSSLVIELLRELVKSQIFPESALGAIKKSERLWLNRQGGYDPYIWEVVKNYRKHIVGKRRRDIVAAGKRVIRAQKLRTYRFTRELLRKLRGKYFMIAISGSPLEVVREYNKFLKFDKIYGTELGVDEKERYTGTVLHEPPRYKKENLTRYAKSHVLSFAGSIGVGDTESDVGIFELVEKPIAFNPNAALAKIAKKRNWTTVIERKDLIVEFKPNKVKFLKI